MNHAGRYDESLLASYECCRRICRGSGSNFVGSFLLLPRRKRHAMIALYAFMRHTDDLADNSAPAENRRRQLEQWRAALDRAVVGQSESSASKSVFIRHEKSDGAALLPALVDTLRRFRIPLEHLHAVIDGVEMDLTPRQYETFEELEHYCHRVASAVGLACLHIWGFRGAESHCPEAIEPARKCGLAMQMTNILRDLGEDAKQGRVYLPVDEMQQHDYAADDLFHGIADERFDRLMAFQIDRAERLYREAAELIPWLHLDGRRIAATMMSTYQRLLAKIKRDPRAVFTSKIHLTPRDKLAIAIKGVRALCFPGCAR